METQAPYSVSGAEQPAPTIFGPDVWAIVEIMGHKRVAGRIRKEGFGNPVNDTAAGGKDNANATEAEYDTEFADAFGDSEIIDE